MPETVAGHRRIHNEASSSCPRKRVAILCLSRPGGIAYYGALLANALSRHGEVMILITSEMQNFSFAENLKVVCVSRRSLLSLPHPQSYRAILREVRAFAPHLVHDTGGNAFKWTFGLWPAIAKRWPLVITEHDPRPHVGMGGFLSQLTRRIAWRSAHHFIVHGKNCRKAMLAAGVPGRKVSINRHGIFAEYDRQRHAGVAEEEHTVLFFGELRPNKGIYRLAEIARRVRVHVPAAKFIVAGRRTQLPSRRARAKVAAAVRALQQEPGFEVHDRFIADEEVERLMRRCAVVILPYEEASQTGVIPVAFAFRKPVVAYDVGDLGESILPGETSLLVPAGEEAAFAEAIVSVLRRPRWRQLMGQRAWQWAQRELSWENIARRTLQDYEKVLAARAL